MNTFLSKLLKLNLCLILLVLILLLLDSPLGIASDLSMAVVKVPNSHGLNTYRNNFLGFEITTPLWMTTSIPVAGFSHSPGDRMYFVGEGNRIPFRIDLNYDVFDETTYKHVLFFGDRMPSESELQSYVQVKSNGQLQALHVPENPGSTMFFHLKVDLEKMRLGKNRFFYYALQSDDQVQYYFIYPVKGNFILFSFFNRPKDDVMSIMKSLHFFHGDYDKGSYRYFH